MFSHRHQHQQQLKLFAACVCLAIASNAIQVNGWSLFGQGNLELREHQRSNRGQDGDFYGRFGRQGSADDAIEDSEGSVANSQAEDNNNITPPPPDSEGSGGNQQVNNDLVVTSESSTGLPGLCNTVTRLLMSDARGWYASPNYPQSYDNSANCQHLIVSPSADEILSISFPEVAMESCCDYVRIYDGNSTSAPLLGEFNGYKSGLSFTTTQRYMLITFTSDGSVTYMGFNATYWVPVDTTGNSVTYSISVAIESNNRRSDVPDPSVSITLYGVTGGIRELLLSNQGENNTFEPGSTSRFVFPDVTSVGIIKCVDIRLSSSQSDLLLYVASVSVEEDSGGQPFYFPIQRFYTVDSTTLPPTHGCGTTYRVMVSTGYDHPASGSGARVSAVLIGEVGVSTELYLNGRYDYLSRGDYRSATFNLPQLGNISCVNLRRDDSGEDPSWYAASITVSSENGDSNIDVNSWVPSTTYVPNGIVVCVNNSRLCLDNLNEACPPTTVMKQLMSKTGSEIIHTLTNMDLFEVCPQIEDYSRCALSFAKLNKNCPEAQQLDRLNQQSMQTLSIVLEKLCGAYIGDFSCHKECLLQVDEDGQLLLPQTILKQCALHLADNVEFAPLCQSREFLECAKNIVTRQCSPGIAEVVANLYGELSTQLCDSTTKPPCPYDFELSEAGCHKLVTDSLSWSSATYTCNRLSPSAHLVFIENDADQQAVNNILRKYDGSRCGDIKSAWTGGRRKQWPPAYRWYYNETSPAKIACNQDWSPNSREYGSESCILLRQATNNSVQWQSYDCYYSYCYICEIDL